MARSLLTSASLAILPLVALSLRFQGDQADLQRLFLGAEGQHLQHARARGDEEGEGNGTDSTMEPHMTESERELLYKYMRSARNYLEYGSGGSTVVAIAMPNIRRIHTVESDGAWIEILRNRSDVHDAIEAGRLNLIHADLGPVKAWGSPTDPERMGDWPKYSGSYAMVQDEGTAYDLILVDGRFRVACVLKSLQRLKEGAEAFVAVHDYERSAYHVVEKFGRQVAHEERLHVFRRRQGLNETQLQQFIDAYNYVKA